MENSSVEKKKKWRLNLFDVIFIACVLVAAGVFLLLSNRSDGGVSIVSAGTQETVVFTMEFQGMHGDTASLIQPGDSLIDRVERRGMGTVVAVELRPSIASQKDMISGDRIITEIPDRTDAIVTVSAQATVTDSQISVNGFGVRVGTRISVNGPLYNGSGFIIDIERGDAT